jgi:hypothetical protein
MKAQNKARTAASSPLSVKLDDGVCLGAGASETIQFDSYVRCWLPKADKRYSITMDISERPLLADCVEKVLFRL